MSKFLSLYRDDRGAAAIEMAFAVPILAFFLWGIFQIGVMFQASAGMQHALGEGARYATLWPTPSDTAIRDRISNTVFGVGVGEFGTPDVATPDEDDCTHCRDLQVTFTMTPNFLLFEGPEFTITRSKRVYLAQN
jgi:hypothetical protein